ncbi:MAG: hypothetical protein ACYDGY_02140 [Acidimicrobiales bacterium]
MRELVSLDVLSTGPLRLPEDGSDLLECPSLSMPVTVTLAAWRMDALVDRGKDIVGVEVIGR